MLSVLHITPDVGPSSFGLGQVALNLVREQNVLGCDAKIWCVSDADDVRWASASGELPEGKIVRFPAVGPRRLAYSPAMTRAAAGPEGGRFGVVHQHGMWTACSRVTNLLHRRHGLPHVVAPHGSLQGWALGRSSFKKSLALAAYERSTLRDAACLHATAESEVADFRNFGLKGPIALIKNGASDRWSNSRGDAEGFRRAHAIPADRRVLFFLSRITPKKGIPMLLEAIRSTRETFAGWVLVIAGTDEFGHKAEVEALVKRLGLDDAVKFVGPLYDQPKRDAFAAADLFVLPSYSEGAPVVVLDSLAVGVPVLTTKGAPWEDVNTYGCGWWTEVSAAGLAEALRAANGTSGPELAAMGRRGRDLVASKYSWSGLAKKTVDLYEWLLGTGDRPDFVVEN